MARDASRQRRLARLLAEYGLPDGDYDAARFWRDRHRKYRGIQGSADLGKSVQQNTLEYHAAAARLVDTLRAYGVTADAPICDMGYGYGYFLDVLHAVGFQRLYGVDICAEHAERVVHSAQASTITADVRSDGIALPEACEAVIALDLTLHLVTDAGFLHFVRQVVQPNLVDGGVFVVSDHRADALFSFYERARGVHAYLNAFAGAAKVLSATPWRDKMLYTFRVTREGTHPVVGMLVPYYGGPFGRFDTGRVHGLALVRDDRIDVLALHAWRRWQGHGGQFLGALKNEYRVVCCWQVFNPIAAAMLVRRGFVYAVDDLGEGSEEVLRWEREDATS